MRQRKAKSRRPVSRLYQGALWTAAILLLIGSFPAIPASAAETETAAAGPASGYAAYLKAQASAARPEREIALSAGELYAARTESSGTVAYEDDCSGRPAVIFEAGSALTFSLTAEEAGLYQLELAYFPLDSTIRDIECGLLLDGTAPFQQAGSLTLPKLYAAAAVTQDNRGNDIRPSTAMQPEWMTHTVADSTGMYGALLFPLKAGQNTVTLQIPAARVAVGALRLYNTAEPPTYAAYRQQHTEETANGFSRLIEAEEVWRRSSSVISLNMDRSGPEVSPCDPTRLKLNTLGGSGWAQPGQYAVWKITVPQSGWYRVAIRYRQNSARGRKVYRSLSVNGTIPFQEAAALSFSFSDSWQSTWLGGENTYELYLNAGENELKLETCLGPYAQVIANADETARELGSLYREIVMVTGQNPDANRDYMLAQEIPDLPDRLEQLEAALHAIEAQLLAIDERSLTDDAATVRTLYVQLAAFLKDTETIPLRLSTFQTNISSFSDFVAGLKKQPLELDAFSVSSPDTGSVLESPGWTEKLRYAVQAFLGSFVSDYASIGNVAEDSDSVELWVNSSGSIGRDQAQILKQVIDSQFTPKTGIAVNLKLVQQALAPAIFSGSGPDVALYIGTGDPVNLAARGGLQELSCMDGFAEFAAGFSKDAFLPHTYNGGVYAVPFTEDFPVLFWRSDIFAELGIQPPATWEEFYEVLSVIQKNNMTVGIPNVQGSQMSTNNTIFAMFLYQRGGQYYTNALDATAFDSEEALAAFRQWTDLYKNYSLPVQYSFYQRFRMGDMPMGIENFTTATLLQVAAPEIDGLWEMAPLPGIADENGQIRNTAIAGGMCSIMLKSAADKDASWQVIKWLSGAEAQTAIGIELETVLGPSGRFTPASHEAFENLPWSQSQSAVIQQQWDNVAFLPQVPGGYYVDRNLTNAFRRTVFYSRNYREALLEYNREINLEITRKRREFGLS